MAFIAPAGTPLSPVSALAGLLKGWISDNAEQSLGDGLAALAGHGRCWLMITGRAGMTVALRAMRRVSVDPDRCEVIVPAYTCYSVPAAVFKAGLKVRLCDVDPETLSLDMRALQGFDTSRVLAIISANLYGLPNQLDQIELFARQRGLMLLDDAAQAMGARIAGRPVGGFGDMGLFSLDKGKNITSLEGGAILASRDEITRAMNEEFARLEPVNAMHTAKTAMKLLVYSVMLRPAAYGLVNRLPGMGLGRTPYDESYGLGRYSPTLAGVAELLLRQVSLLTSMRSQNAQLIMDALEGSKSIRLPRLIESAQPAFARLPVFARDPQERAGIIEALVKDGIGATRSYPSSLNKVPEVAGRLPASDLRQPGAEIVAATVVTLPTHAYVPADIGRRIRAILDNA
jgi:perosamine synthetase